MSDLIQRQEVIIALRESGLCYNNWLEVLGVIDAVPNAKEHIKNGDLIRRQDVLNMIIVAGECEPDLGYTHLHKVVENIPSADRPTGWIPCSERLPENSGCVLISIAGDIEFGAYDRQNSDWAIWRDGYWDEGKRADAWMPLPEPYKGGDSDG